MTASELVGLVQPMMWDYTSNLDVDKTGRSSIWHYDNHFQFQLCNLYSDACSMTIMASGSVGEVPQCWYGRPMGSKFLQRLHNCQHKYTLHTETCRESPTVVKCGSICFFWATLKGHCHHRLAKVRIQGNFIWVYKW